MAAEKTREKIVDGIDVIKLHDTIKQLRQEPELAKFKLRAKQKWVNGAHCRTEIKDFYGAGENQSHDKTFEVEADEPALLLGEDYGPNATEALLHALVSCLDTTLVYHAAAKGIQLDEVEWELEGDLDIQGFLGIDERVRNGFQQIRVKFKIKADVSDEQVQELCELAKKRSPVFDCVTNTVPVTVTCERK